SRQFSTFYGSSVQSMDTQLGTRHRRRTPTIQRGSDQRATSAEGAQGEAIWRAIRSSSRLWRTELMANVELLTLAKALSVKNRLAGRLAQARENIETYNSVLAGQRDDYGKATVDVRAEYNRYRKLQDGLIVVKAAIQRAKLPIIKRATSGRSLTDFASF